MVTLWELDRSRGAEMRTLIGIGGNRHCAFLSPLERRRESRGAWQFCSQTWFEIRPDMKRISECEAKKLRGLAHILLKEATM